MQRFRVECNFGCRYFKDIVKAQRYFEKCRSKGANIWKWSCGRFRICIVRFSKSSPQGKTC